MRFHPGEILIANGVCALHNWNISLRFSEQDEAFTFLSYVDDSFAAITENRYIPLYEHTILILSSDCIKFEAAAMHFRKLDEYSKEEK